MIHIVEKKLTEKSHEAFRMPQERPRKFREASRKPRIGPKRFQGGFKKAP